MVSRHLVLRTRSNGRFVRIAPLSLILLLLSATVLPAAPAIQFEANLGQTDSNVRYLARSAEGRAFFTDTHVVFSAGEGDGVRIHLRGSRADASWNPLEPTGEKMFYRIGRDPKRWVDQVPRYRRLMRRDIYPGIDVLWHGDGKQLEYDFIVAPGAAPDLIRLFIDGADSALIDVDGDLIAKTKDGEFRQRRPTVYQTSSDGAREAIPGAFQLLPNGEVGFSVGTYDHLRPLVIDPVIEFSSYLGGQETDEILYRTQGFVAGNMVSPDFSPGAPFQKAGSKVFFRYSNFTFVIGGSGNDRLTAVWPPSVSGFMFLLAGYTDSRDLPTGGSFGALQPNYGGGASDGFIIGVNPNIFPFSTTTSYYGTDGEDRITATASLSSCAFTGWTTGRGLLTGLLTQRGQPAAYDFAPRGADGFVVRCTPPSSSSSLSLSLSRVQYFGGSGDDRPMGIVSSSTTRTYITGETTSADLPNLSPASTTRAGESDAFVIRLDGNFQNPSSLLFGGSGRDTGNGVVFTGGGVGIAGTTGSPDLALVRPTQAAFGGGASDAFLLVAAEDLSQSLYATYWGGSGNEEVASAVTDSWRGWFVGGWTSSPDFPTQQAVQPQYGGGADDGFFLHLTSSDGLYQSTFLGGSGSDRVLGISSTSYFTASLSGQTTSPDFPLVGPEQSELGGGSSDGFTARISANLIGATSAVGSRGLLSFVSLFIPSTARFTTFTLTVSEPAAVLLSRGSGGVASPSIAIAGQEGYFIECQAEGVAADISVTGPGFPDTIIHVDCVRPSLFPSVSTSSVNGVYRLSTWSDPIFLGVGLRAVSPTDPTVFSFPRFKNETDRLYINAQVSDPAVLQLSAPALWLPGEPLIVNAAGRGSAEIVLSSTETLPLTLRFEVTTPLIVPARVVIPGGFQSSLNPAFTGRRPTGVSVTFTSGDTSSLLVSSDVRVTGSQTVTVPLGATGSPSAWLQALKTAGEATLTIAVTGFDPVTVPVQFSEPLLNTSGVLTVHPRLELNEVQTVTGSFGLPPNPQNDGLRLSLEVSDSSVVQVTPASVTLSTSTATANFQVTGASAGTASLTLRSNTEAATAPTSVNPLSITVAPIGELTMADFHVGANLVAQGVLVLPRGTRPGARVTISSADPAKVLLSSFSDGSGSSPQLNLTASLQLGINRLGFVVVGQSLGDARITADVEGVGTVAATVTVLPSGFVWGSSLQSAPVTSNFFTASIFPYALDPVTLAPLRYQQLRSGLTVTLGVESDRPDIAAPTASSAVVRPGEISGGQVRMQNFTVGDAVITLRGPEGFAIPSARQQMTWRVTSVPVPLSGNQGLAQNTQAEFRISTLVDAYRSKTARINSADPAKLRVSADPGVLGGGALDIDPSLPFWVQALDSSGVVQLTASIEGYLDASLPITLMGVGIRFSPLLSEGGGAMLDENGTANTTLNSGRTTIAAQVVRLSASNEVSSLTPYERLRPGLDGTVTFQSSAPSVGTIDAPFMTLNSTGRGTVGFLPASLGSTDIIPVLPPGVTLIGPHDRTVESLRFNVTLPTLRINLDGGLRPDFLYPTFVELAPNAAAQNSDRVVTIQSSDPALLLLTPDAATPPSASISVTIQAGSRLKPLFVRRPSGAVGRVRLTMTGPGFMDSFVDVTLF